MIPEEDKKEVMDAVTIGVSEDGMIHIYTRLDLQGCNGFVGRCV